MCLSWVDPGSSSWWVTPEHLTQQASFQIPEPTQLAPQQVSSNKRQNYCMNDSPGYVMVKKQQQQKEIVS